MSNIEFINMDNRQKIYIIYRKDLLGNITYIPRVFTSKFAAGLACRMFNFESCKYENTHSYFFEALTANIKTYERRFENQGLHE